MITLSAMKKMVPSVSVTLLMKADRKVAADHEASLEPDVIVSIVSSLHDECEPEEMIAISHRLRALANLIVDGDSGGWTIDVEGEKHVLVSGELIRAAASATLPMTKTVGELRFDPQEILEIALRDADASGSA